VNPRLADDRPWFVYVERTPAASKRNAFDFGVATRSTAVMIRPTVLADTPALIALTQGTGLFLPIDLAALDSVLEGYHREEIHAGHRAFTYEQNGQPIGFVYYAPAAMTDRTWYLWWIVVSKQVQAKGLGSQLLKLAEDGARAEKGRLLMVETSGLPTYELTRKFYLKHGYEQAGVLKDYYADGHDMVIYRKRL
jgi:ribosomal protein S18 acetylase RimI-like enzyme